MTLSGPRSGRPTWWRRVVAAAAADQLTAFAVPGREVLTAMNVDLPAVGLRLVANPRHASVLVLAGAIPPGLAIAAARVHAQMPRPRAILAIGASGSVAPLPIPEVTVAASQTEVEAAAAALSALFRAGAWTSDNGARHEMGSMDMGGMEPGAGGGHDMAHMAGGGFMSMVMMTQDLPRSADGLPMEWLEVPFGPLFAGLPGGLGLRLTLDGDTVVRARVAPGALAREVQRAWLGPVDGFVERFAAFDPLSPRSYQVLAERALAAAGGGSPDARPSPHQVGLVERERAASRLNWLASFAFLLGDGWLQSAALALHHRLGRAPDRTALTQVRDDARALVRRVARTPLLAHRLGGIGRLESAQVTAMDGSVAQAASSWPSATAWMSSASLGNDALARLHLRLAQLAHSLDVVLASSGHTPPAGELRVPDRGTGEATIETPRGAASLHIEIADGQVIRATVAAPSPKLAALIPAVAEGHELADALIAIASLDISPWEIDR